VPLCYLLHADAIKNGFRQAIDLHTQTQAEREEHCKQVINVQSKLHSLGERLRSIEIWSAVMENNPSHFQGAKRPAERVSWHDCQTFIRRMNERFADLALALPTEAQWEYACRTGTEGSRYHEELDAIAWYENNSGGETREVGQKTPNRWGLYDMLGNVAEWCYDGMREYTDAFAVNPVGPTEAGALRVFRGSGWDWLAQDVRATYRFAVPPGGRFLVLGLRCASSGSQAS
jgi:formylglycine-generating enzyme required for sulfatase activity